MNSALRIPRPFPARIWLLWSEMHEMEIVERTELDIPVEYRWQVFGRYERFDVKSERELGLYYAQLIAQQHGSRIAEGLDGLGTIFQHPPANPSQNANFIR